MKIRVECPTKIDPDNLKCLALQVELESDDAQAKALSEEDLREITRLIEQYRLVAQVGLSDFRSLPRPEIIFYVFPVSTRLWDILAWKRRRQVKVSQHAIRLIGNHLGAQDIALEFDFQDAYWREDAVRHEGIWHFLPGGATA